MLRRLYLVLILTGISACFAAKSVKPMRHAAILKSDTSSVNVKSFDTAALRAYSKQPEFRYSDEASGPSLWTRFWRWFWHLFDFLAINGYPSGSLVKLILKLFEFLAMLAAVGAVVFFVLKMIGVDASNMFRRKPKPVTLPYSEDLENIHEIDFEAEIDRAAAQHNYRLAVRLLYLKSLKQLNDASLIMWQPEKTNSAYINELNNTGQYMAFKQLTRQFEYVWYGDFAIDGAIFKHIYLLFQTFKNDIA